MTELSDSDLDALLLAKVRSRWQKTAKIVADAMMPIDSWDEERLANRLLDLAAQDKIEVKGDLKNWRYSEIRLPEPQ